MAEIVLEFPEDELRRGGVSKPVLEEYRRAWVGASPKWRESVVDAAAVEGGAGLPVTVPDLPRAAAKAAPEPITEAPVVASPTPDGDPIDPDGITLAEDGDELGAALASVRSAKEFAAAHPDRVAELIAREGAAPEPRKSLLTLLQRKAEAGA